MALDDPYGAGIWSQYEQAQENAPLLAGKLQANTADVAHTQAQTLGLQQATAQASAMAPAALAKSQAEATTAGVAADQATVLSPLEIAAKQAELSQQRAASQLAGTRLNGQALARDLATWDPNAPDAGQTWDKTVQKYIDAGWDGAKQFLGHASTAAQATIEGAYGGGPAQTPLEATTAAKSAGGMASELEAVRSTPAVENYKMQLANMPPAQFAQAKAMHDGITAAIEEIDAAKPEDRPALINKYAGQYAQLSYLGDHLTPWGWEQFKKNEAPGIEAFNEVAAEKGFGLKTPPPQQHIETPYGGTTTMGHIDPNTGKFVTDQTVTSADTRAGANPTAQRTSVADEAGLTGQARLDYIAGKNTGMTAAVQASINNHINADMTSWVNNQRLMGVVPTPADQATYRGQLEAQYGVTPGGGGPAAGGGGGPQIPAPALQAIQAAGGKPVTFQNGQVWKWVNGAAQQVK